MKQYKVILHSDAETDISSAFEWGRHAWGEESARTWVRQLYRNLRERLSSTPLRCPVAPESEELGITAPGYGDVGFSQNQGLDQLCTKTPEIALLCATSAFSVSLW